MPFCPICKDEYREGFTTCADCHVPLVDKLEEPESPPPEPKKLDADLYADVDVHKIPRDKDVDFELVFFKNVFNEQEAAMVSGVLSGAGIPCHTSLPNISQYTRLYFGLMLEGVNIYVRKQDLQKATEILDGALIVQEDIEENTEEE